MDLNMPVMDGVEATQLIKGKYPDQIIIAITAVSQERVDEVKSLNLFNLINSLLDYNI